MYSESLEDIGQRITQCRETFERERTSRQQQQEAVRHLGEIAVVLRSRAKEKVRSQAEMGLFYLAEDFGVTYGDVEGQIAEDTDLWLKWAFHHYLAAAQVLMGLASRG